MSFRRMSWFNRYKAPIIVCTGALITGLISFMVTVKVYDNNIKNELNNKIQNKVVSNFSGDNNNIIAKVDNEKTKNEVISEGGKSTTIENLGEDDFGVIEISENDYNDFINILAKNEEIKVDEVIETIANVDNESGEIEEKKVLEFIMPVSGEIGLNYATEKLIYSKTS